MLAGFASVPFQRCAASVFPAGRGVRRPWGREWRQRRKDEAEAAKARSEAAAAAGAAAKARRERAAREGQHAQEAARLEQLGSYRDRKLREHEDDASAPQSRDFFKKIPVFTLIYYGFRGDETGGVDRSVVEALYKGTWRDKLARNLPLKTLLWNVFLQLLTGAA